MPLLVLFAGARADACARAFGGGVSWDALEALPSELEELSLLFEFLDAVGAEAEPGSEDSLNM